MSLNTVWTHGNSLRVEDPGEYQNVRHRGWGTVLTYARRRDDEKNLDSLSPRYCHIPIPTPTAVDGTSPWLTHVYVLFETQGYAKLGGLGLWDADNLLQSFADDSSGLAGRFGGFLTISKFNTFTLAEPPVVQRGIGVTLAVQLDIIPDNDSAHTGQPPAPPSTDSDPWILTVTAVGADFVFPRSPLTVFTGFSEATLQHKPIKVHGK
jgi:hypothetical protein